MVDVRFRAMNHDDIPTAMRLSSQAGWNQTEADWRRLLNGGSGGSFAATFKDEVVGTVTTITYEGRLSWVGMVLVDAPYRGRGIGTKLMEKAIAHLDRTGVTCVKLDATPAGRPLYEKLGFRREYEIERWQLKRPSVPDAPHQVDPNSAKVFVLDRTAFGADRRKLLISLSEAAPHLALTAADKAKIAGYVFGRKGLLADHLGPWVATSKRVAAKLLDEFLQSSQRDLVFVDCVIPNRWAQPLLKSRGFTSQRPLSRMYRGQNDCAGQPHLVGAILGPEFG